MADAADRQRRRRDRHRQGLALLTLVVDPVDLAARLIGARYLSPAAEDDPAALARAVEKLLGDLKSATLG
jgi:hypothetical protein